MTHSVSPIDDDRRIRLRRGSAPATTFTTFTASPASRPTAHR